MVLASAIHIALLPALWLVVIWLLTMQLLSLLIAPVPGNAVLAWYINILGISALYLRRPHPVLRFFQFSVPIIGAAALTSYLLTMPELLPLAITGLADMTLSRWTISGGLTLVLSLPRLLGALREWRHPLWGEARLLDRASRSGNVLYFTAAGRTYITERFGASPSEFVRIIRRRSSSLVTGTP